VGWADRSCLQRRIHAVASNALMTMPDRLPGVFLTRVLRSRTPCCAHFELTLELDDFPPAVPGQFLEVLCRTPQDHDGPAASPGDHHTASPAPTHPAPQYGAMLRRPFSIAALRRSTRSCEIDLLGRVTGEGTAWLAAREGGDIVSILGPLGRGFTKPPPDARALLIAGGIGLPPVRWLGEELRKNNLPCDAIYGAVSREALPVTLLSKPLNNGTLSACVEEFARHGIETLVTTDDGTCGMKGQVTDGLRSYCRTIKHPASVHVYACGAEGMLQAIALFCAEQGMPCEVALERKMGCGMGTCQSCVVPVADIKSQAGWRYALCCTDGPVFKAADVQWQRARC
jgi:dihydroorotate dehydrogenase electron transfer subunit